MNREEILQKSREENKGMDVAERDASRQDAVLASMVALVVATALYVIELLIGKGLNPALYVVALSIQVTTWGCKARRTKDRNMIIVASMFAFALLMMLVAYIITLFKA